MNSFFLPQQQPVYHPKRTPHRKVSPFPNNLLKSVTSEKTKEEQQQSTSVLWQDFLKLIDRSEDDFKTFVAGFSNSSSASQNQVVTPFDGAYAQARQESDPLFIKYPYLVVYCMVPADIRHAIKFANGDGKKQKRIPICARSGGHSTAGFSIIDQGMIIDVSRMKGIFVDTEDHRYYKPENDGKTSYNEVGRPALPYGGTALVQTGANWGIVKCELQAHVRHVPCGDCSGVGIAGYSMGGGYGCSSMGTGVTADNIVEVHMVTSDGRFVTATQKDKGELHDLWWAVCGGTGNQFGIVYALRYQLYKIPEKLYTIVVNWPIEVAAKLLHTWQELIRTKTIDRRLGVLGFITFEDIVNGPSITGKPYITLRGVYLGESLEDAKKAMKPFLDLPGWKIPKGWKFPLWSEQSRLPYDWASEHDIDDIDGIIPASINEIKRCAYVNHPLSEKDYQTIVDKFCKLAPSPYNILSLEAYGGRNSDLKPDERAFCHRQVFFDIFVDSFWSDPDQKDNAYNWLKSMFEDPEMRPIWEDSNGKLEYYQNYPSEDYTDWQWGYFGNNYEKLCQVKKHWDPNNVFSTFSQAIGSKPSSSSSSGAPPKKEAKVVKEVM